jgi:amino acid adenylation domain-containing protein
MITGILGVLKAGCAYVPISPDATERNRYIVSDSEISILLIQDSLLNSLSLTNSLTNKIEIIAIKENDQASTNTDYKSKAISPNHLINIIYTSGTTGEPRGVEVMHKGIVNYTSWRIRQCGYLPEDVTLQMTPYYFDAFAASLYSSLLSGGTLVLLPEENKFDAKYVVNTIRENKITNFSMTPAFYDAILDKLDHNEGLESLHFIVLGGEKASVKLLKKSKEKLPNVLLYNEYGPTEASVAATFNKHLSIDDASIIGKPIDNTYIYILGKRNELVPLGLPGELCISGVGVAHGYLHNEELTQEKFIVDPYRAGLRLYKTGDLARWLPDGNIEYLGRLDTQIKIRGFRVELGEIERQLSSHSQIRETVVVAKGEGSDKYLVAYYVGEKEFEEGALRSYLSGKLPEYMVPSYYLSLEKIPLTPNGKIDRKSLPSPAVTAGDSYQAPCTEIEEKLVTIWSEVLKIDRAVISVGRSFLSWEATHYVLLCW